MRADHIVFPSPYSRELFEKYYRRLPAVTHVAPLLVPDHPNGVTLRRQYFCMVGRMHHATGHDTFLDLVNHAATQNLPYRFAMVCADDLSQYLSRVSPEGKKVLTVVSKPLIHDSEIDAVLRESYAVFRLAREVTQSGVVPVAYMNHTPVIARDILGLRQHVTHRQNGYLVPADCTLTHILEAMRFVEDHFTSLSENARRSYEETWSEANWDTYYGWLLDLLGDCESCSRTELC
jgi:glycosyltransferase involved in cell wall biosynthesis